MHGGVYLEIVQGIRSSVIVVIHEVHMSSIRCAISLVLFLSFGRLQSASLQTFRLIELV